MSLAFYSNIAIFKQHLSVLRVVRALERIADGCDDAHVKKATRINHAFYFKVGSSGEWKGTKSAYRWPDRICLYLIGNCTREIIGFSFRFNPIFNL